jgi:HPt (histidine-containing phosphotransfer) domain-containing protein
MHTPSPIHSEIFIDFQNLLPQVTVRQQMQSLSDPQNSDIHAMVDLLVQGTEQAKHNAHQLKGACQLMGFTSMAEILASIEYAIAHKDSVEHKALVAQLFNAANETRIAVASLLIHKAA